MSKTPRIGDPVLYRWRPGQVRAGQPESAAIITRINNDDTVELVTFLPQSEPINQNRVPVMSDKVTGHCWHPREVDGVSPEVLAAAVALALAPAEKPATPASKKSAA